MCPKGFKCCYGTKAKSFTEIFLINVRLPLVYGFAYEMDKGKVSFNMCFLFPPHA